MKIKIAKRLNNFDEHIFAKFNKIIAQVEKESGRKVLNLGAGNPDLKPSDKYIDKLCEFIKGSKAHLYPGYGAQKEFEEALINWYKKRFNVVLQADELYPLLGGKDGVAHLPFSLLDEGDEVLVPDPGYFSFGDAALMVGAKVVTYNLLAEDNFNLDLQELKNKITQKTKFVWVNFPSNPTGRVVDLDELKKIVDFCKENNLFIVYDHAYSEITFDGVVAPSILEIEGAKDIAIELGSFSKTFSFAGFRMGWVVGNKEVITALAKVKSQIDSGLSTPLQQLSAFTLNNFDENWHKQMIKTYKERRDIIATYLEKIGLKFNLSKGSLYIWAQIPENEKGSEEFCLNLLKQKQIFLAPGIAFGKNSDRFIRASICTDINKIEDYF